MDYPGIAEQNLLQEQPFNADDPEQVKKRNNAQRKKAARVRKEELDFIKAIMSSLQGRKWMYNLIEECKSWGNPIIPGDVYLTYENLGRQNIGKKLFQDVGEAAPEEYVLMLKEARELTLLEREHN